MIRSIRVYITEKCNADCPTCFNKDERSSASMSFEMFRQICDLFSENGIGHIKIMGGEPTLHPEFKDFVAYSQTKFAHIHLFTNGVTNKLQQLNLREGDSIVYNFRFADSLNEEKLLLRQPGKRAIEIQINASANPEKIIKDIQRVSSIDANRIVNVLTLDCTANIFLCKDEFVRKYVSIWKYCLAHNYKLYQDHKIPLCWLYGTDIPLIYDTESKCKIECSGLIDASGYLKYCNQYQEPLIQIFDNGKIIPYDIILNYLKQAHYKIQHDVLSKICKSCILYDKNCNGGCFMGKDYILCSDVINNTRFPIIKY